uniref:Uncharacterized protein n=1 Tax=Ascaris lumbricoides TaxID=6252 RepID=A0A0M3IVV1_ASCLU
MLLSLVTCPKRGKGRSGNERYFGSERQDVWKLGTGYSGSEEQGILEARNTIIWGRGTGRSESNEQDISKTSKKIS